VDRDRWVLGRVALVAVAAVLAALTFSIPGAEEIKSSWSLSGNGPP
jgi:hypothetical protein